MTPEDYEKVTRKLGRALLSRCLLILISWLVGGWIFNTAYNVMGLGVDSTDLSGWERSGLRLHTDYGTGVQYLSAPGGGITPRIDKNGNLVTLESANDRDD